MSRIPFFCIVVLLVGAFSSSRWERVNADGPGEAKVPELVQLEGKFVGIKATNKRHQSYIFEFQASHQLHGPGQLPTDRKALVRFELFDGAGGRDLLVKLHGGGFVKLQEVIDALPKTPRFDAVFWLKPLVKGADGFEADLAAPPVSLRD